MDNRTTRVEFAERVQQLRRERGLTEEQLAEASGLSYRTIRRRLKFAGGFTLDELAAIAEPRDESLAADEREAIAQANFTFLLSGHREPLQVSA